MSRISRVTEAAMRPLATTEGRKRALVLLVALPLALCFAAGAALGALAQSMGWSAPILAAIGVAALLGTGLLGRRLLRTAESIRARHASAWLQEKLRPLRLAPSAEEPLRVDVIHPAVDLKHFFGGFIAIFNLMRRLAERGNRVRLIATERSALPSDWRARIAGYEGLSEVLDRIEVVFADDRQSVPINPGDSLIATHWTVAHIAAAALGELEAERFAYLIQEYEPSIFAQGSAAALARGSYDLPHGAVFSTDLLRDYFAAHRIGVFAAGEDAGRARSAVFDNAITPVGPVEERKLSRGGSRRLLFYARPEQHAQRNLFEVGTMALDRAIAGGGLEGWELLGVGSVEPGTDALRLPESGARVEMIPRSSQAEYAGLLRSCDVGLALMYTAHPSLVPIEMAAAGMSTVTNTFENKDAAALAAISPNLIAAQPDVESVVAALREAEQRSADLAARARGSKIEWPSDWDRALDDDVMARIEALLDPAPRG